MKRIIIDTDPGIDDALALFLALASPEVQVEAVTTVHGNVSLEHTTANALALLQLAGRADIVVAQGSSRPLISEPMYGDVVHGENGLGGVSLPVADVQPSQQHAVQLIIEKVMASPGEITLVALGPLTNLALAVRQEPALVQAVQEVIIMGGALRVPGNVTPCAEFNILTDAHAAQIVFRAGWPLRIVALDVTHQAILIRQQTHELATNGHTITDCIRRMVDFYCDRPMHQNDLFPMHDPLCMAAAIRPELLTWEDAWIDVELTGTHTFGETVASFAQTGRPLPTRPNAQAAIAVEADAFIQFYLERIRTAFSV